MTASMGIVSAVGGEWRTWHGGRIDRFVRLDLAIYDGFSGGPLVNAAGRVLGIDTSGLTRGAPIAIPASTVDRVVDALASAGRVARGYVGLALQPVRIPERAVSALSLAQDGALLVVGVEGGGPADAAGVVLGDVIYAVDGSPVREPAELLGLLSAERIGQTVRLRLLRGGDPREVEVTIGERVVEQRSAREPRARRRQ